MKRGEMATGEVARKFGCTAQTVRRWHEKGILRAKRITPGGRLVFGEAAVKALYATREVAE